MLELPEAARWHVALFSAVHELRESLLLSARLSLSPRAVVHKAKRYAALLTQLCSDVLWVQANEHITQCSIPHKHHIFPRPWNLSGCCERAVSVSERWSRFWKRPVSLLSVLLSSSFHDLSHPLVFCSLTVFNY